jgi:hypothetical protein
MSRAPNIKGGASVVTSLYDLSVPTFLQTVRAVGSFLDRAVVHCAQTGAKAGDLVEARLFPDMAPFWFQIECVDNYSAWGLEAMRTGNWTPPPLAGQVPFAALQARIAGTEAALKAFDPDEVNRWSGKHLEILVTHVSPQPLALTSETFLLSVLLPNFHFHAVTAYDLLRMHGVPLGKRDYEGQIRTRST